MKKPVAKKRLDRATLDDVARVAGVGIATVDRVVNDRGGVSERTVRKVIAAAQELGLRRILPTPYQGGLRIEIFLTQVDTAAIRRLNNAFVRTASTLDRSVTIQRNFYGEWPEAKVVSRILNTRGNGVIVYGHQAPAVVDALTKLTERGIPVVAVVSDLPAVERRLYVGINNEAAGRTAAYFMSKMTRTPGDVLVVYNELYSGQISRLDGFKRGMADYGPDLKLTPVVNGGDEIPLANRRLKSAMRDVRNLVGIYNAGAANHAIERTLVEHGLAGRVSYIAHELTDITIRLLGEGLLTMVIDQNPEMEARMAIETLLYAITRDAKEPQPPHYVPFTIHTIDTLPPP